MSESTDRVCGACHRALEISCRERNPRKWCDANCRAWAIRHPGLVRDWALRVCAAPHCEETFEPRGRKRFCSQFCCEVAGGKRRAPGSLGHLITCEQCGEERYVQHLPAKVCSEECRRAWTTAKGARWRSENLERDRDRERRRDRSAYQAIRRARRIAARVAAAAEAVRAKPTLALLAGEPQEAQRPPPLCHLSDRPKPRLFVAGVCAGCGGSFVALGLQHRYCSPVCGKRVWRRNGDRGDASARRRARKKGAFVARVVRMKIYERDGWRCQLCGKAVRRKAQVPHSLAPVLDHIVLG
jgi:hypothetical protein